MKICCNNVVRYLLAIILSGSVSCALAADKEVRIGVLSYRPLEQTRQQWQPTEEYLNRHVAGYHFTVVPMFYLELGFAVSRHKFDFVLTNPEHYLTLHADFSLSSTATLMPLAEGKPVTVFGGVILTRTDRTDINTLDDVRGKTVASPTDQSLGGYLMQRWTLYKRGIAISEVAHMQFTGMPQDKVVLEVLNGRADIGFVRTGILENMAREGIIRLEQFKVLNRQPAGSFPQLVSTDLYPEWSFAAMPHVAETLVKQVTLALLNIQPQDAAAQQGRYYGFAPPGDYESVKVMMDRLGLETGDGYTLDMHDLMRKYALELIVTGIVLLLGVLGVGIFLARTNRDLRHSYQERQRLDDALQLANETLEKKVEQRTQELHQSQTHLQTLLDSMEEGMYGVDMDGNCTFVNNAFLRILGFDNEQELLGKHLHTLIHHTYPDGRPYPKQECKIYQSFSLNQATHCATEVYWRRDGAPVSVEFWAHPIIENGEVKGAVVTFLGIAERIKLETQMRELAYYDPLTKLANRRLVRDSLHKMLAGTTRHHCHGALMFLDLDNFKTVNDTEGHEVGDRLLIEVARRMQLCVRESDLLGRIGGDEFVVMCDGLSEDRNCAAVQAEALAEKIRDALAQPYHLDHANPLRSGVQVVHHCSSSIGVTLFYGYDADEDELLKRADIAMYQAKQAGRNVVRFFDPQMQAVLDERTELEKELRQALDKQQFSLYYQLKIGRDGRPVGAEALLRWQHPQRGVILPEQFIGLLEETGMIVPVGYWVLVTVCRQITSWQSHPRMRDLTISVNVSSRQFRQPDCVSKIQQALAAGSFPPRLLDLELTESVLLESLDDTIAKMNQIKAMGLSFSLDDFGTGYSSLQYLKKLPFGSVKIDQSFVRDVVTDANDAAIIKAMSAMAKELELQVVAEGVETEMQFELLQRLGCNVFQGFLFSKPVPIDQFEQLIENGMQ